jgi:hypothetical protein
VAYLEGNGQIAFRHSGDWLKDGDTGSDLTLWVNPGRWEFRATITSTQDYWGEWDEEVDIIFVDPKALSDAQYDERERKWNFD